MQPTWPTFALGVLFGVGVTVAIGFSIDVRFPAFPDFCDQKETLLSCSRNWANAFAILAGAAVVVVTVRGQRDERDRHRETIRSAQKADAMRLQRAGFPAYQLKQAAFRLAHIIDAGVGHTDLEFRQYMMANVSKIYELMSSIYEIPDNEKIKAIMELLDPLTEMSREVTKAQCNFCRNLIGLYVAGAFQQICEDTRISSMDQILIATGRVKTELKMLIKEAVSFAEGVEELNARYNA